jgi:hypothetical protein
LPSFSGWKNKPKPSEAGSKDELGYLLHVDLRVLYFDPEDGGDMFL